MVFLHHYILFSALLPYYYQGVLNIVLFFLILQFFLLSFNAVVMTGISLEINKVYLYQKKTKKLIQEWTT